jgi:hypothetical protein
VSILKYELQNRTVAHMRWNMSMLWELAQDLYCILLFVDNIAQRHLLIETWILEYVASIFGWDNE